MEATQGGDMDTGNKGSSEHMQGMLLKFQYIFTISN